jgi:hypothetical protein
MAPSTLSAVLVMPRGFDELSGAIAHLRAQTRRAAIEVVLVHTVERAHEIDAGAFEGFLRFVPVAIAALPMVAAGFVAAVDAASGEVIALVEDHVLLDPDWAATVLAAHAHPCAAVAPHMRNGNPGTATSWGNFLVSFGDAFSGRAFGPVESGPGHNTSYKRSVLDAYRGDLLRFYQSERNFHFQLRRDGHVILYEPRARLAHLNISVGLQALRHAFLGGVLFGTYRAGRMRLPEIAARTALAPLVPPLRLWRLLRSLAAAPPALRAVPGSAWLLVPALLVAHAAGEAAGYWRLVGDIEARYEYFELHRIECLVPHERVLMTSGVVG